MDNRGAYGKNFKAQSAAERRDLSVERNQNSSNILSGGECIGCGRIMSVRERNEQGVCNGCSTGDYS